MSIKKDLHFWKMTAGGNDFIINDNFLNPPQSFSPAEINSLCSRRLSIGADGLILLEKSKNADVRMIYFNADGGRAALCANGVRCSARLAFMKKIAKDIIKIETDAGIYIAEDRANKIGLQMIPPTKVQLNLSLQLKHNKIKGHVIDVGVPFFVIQYDNEINSCPVVEWGSQIRYHPHFKPAGSNVTFFTVKDKHNLILRIYERGVEAETLSSGSGCLSTALIAAALGLVESPVNCHTMGGSIIKVSYAYKDGSFANLSIEGDARVIYEGIISPQVFKRPPTMTIT